VLNVHHAGQDGIFLWSRRVKAGRKIPNPHEQHPEFKDGLFYTWFHCYPGPNREFKDEDCHRVNSRQHWSNRKYKEGISYSVSKCLARFSVFTHISVLHSDFKEVLDYTRNPVSEWTTIWFQCLTGQQREFSDRLSLTVSWRWAWASQWVQGWHRELKAKLGHKVSLRVCQITLGNPFSDLMIQKSPNTIQRHQKTPKLPFLGNTCASHIHL
jgi:hypothetical protein